MAAMVALWMAVHNGTLEGALSSIRGLHLEALCVCCTAYLHVQSRNVHPLATSQNVNHTI